MSGASEASTGAAPPVDASANAPDFSPCPLPSYRQFVQKALAGIIKVGDHAEPVDALDRHIGLDVIGPRP